jgi:hypothetical protein
MACRILSLLHSAEMKLTGAPAVRSSTRRLLAGCGKLVTCSERHGRLLVFRMNWGQELELLNEIKPSSTNLPNSVPRSIDA